MSSSQIPPAEGESATSRGGEALTAPAGGYWATVLFRGAVTLGVALLITFSSDHSASVGHTSFALFALLAGAAQLIGAWLIRREAHGPTQAHGWTQALAGLVTLAAGVVALILPTDAGIAPFLVLASCWAALAALAELLPGLALRGKSALARDWISTGILTAVFALGLLVVDPELAHHYVVTDPKLPSVEHVLTGDIVAVGVFGFYTALLGVFLIIAALSLRFPPKARVRAAATPSTASTHGATS